MEDEVIVVFFFEFSPLKSLPPQTRVPSKNTKHSSDKLGDDKTGSIKMPFLSLMTRYTMLTLFIDRNTQ